MATLADIVVGAAASRPDTLSGLHTDLMQRLQAMLDAAPPEIKQALRLTSGYRSPQVQQQLWDEALRKYGDPQAARKWVAPPGRSRHNHGTAADLKFMSPAAQQWVHANAANFGLAFPLKHEPWHVELADARGGQAPAAAAQAPAPVAPAPSELQGLLAQGFAPAAEQVAQAAPTPAPMPAAMPAIPAVDPWSTFASFYSQRQQQAAAAQERMAQEDAARKARLAALLA